MSKKNLDQKGRLCEKIVSFRVSPEEWEMLDRKVALSRHTKQDYIISCILEKEIAVYGNPYVFRNLKEELMKFTSLYGTQISEEDEEMMVWTLKMIIAMKSKDMSFVTP
ncbi:plasmid mobilization protein [Thomasclavelia spiroformis]|uniref:plasmid mobilization protein n=1 Tax=Thomasclavelia spiroformis TaxID=29348 RepID=UPI003C6FFF15